MCAGVICECWRCSASARACSRASSISLDILSRSIAIAVLSSVSQGQGVTPIVSDGEAVAFPKEHDWDPNFGWREGLEVPVSTPLVQERRHWAGAWAFAVGQ